LRNEVKIWGGKKRGRREEVERWREEGMRE
jgi:hypothetical protein